MKTSEMKFMTSADVLQATKPFSLRPYTAYTYAYPHKTAYRPLESPRSLCDVWSAEDRSRLFLYIHIPFCEVRCGFCNLFTIARAGGELSTDYLATLQRQVRAFKQSLPDARFVRLAIGGGTPTFLHCHELQQLFTMLRDELDVDAREIPCSCEASPGTIDLNKLQLLKESGVDRLSMGVQSFDEREAAAMGRPQRSDDVVRALDLLSKVKFSTLNLDLIYGAENQSAQSFVNSVQRVVDYGAEELFLYPLYVRQLTGLGKRQSRLGEPDDSLEWEWDRQRLDSYNAARDALEAAGYHQLSMRNFMKTATEQTAPEYCCQIDGMVGLGCGARSYTSTLHYSGEYAVGVTAIKSILLDYMQRSADSFQQVNYGFNLDADEQRRRFLLMSLLQTAGLERSLYRQRFGSDAVEDFPQLGQLERCGLAVTTSGQVTLTPEGLAWTDAIGPWLYSDHVSRLSEGYQWQ